MPETGKAMRWIPKSAAGLARQKNRKTRSFRDDPESLDISQAQRSAYEWHGRLWSPLLYRYASLGCRIGNDEFTRGLFREIELAMQAVAASAQCYGQDEPAKLRNLKRCVEIGKATGPSRGQKGGTESGSSRLSHRLARQRERV
jgi:hypothetical protein